MSTSSYGTNFDLDDPQFPAKFDEISGEVLEKCPVAHSPALGGYKVVFRDEDIRRIARDWKLWSNRFGYEPSRNADDNARLYPLEIDPPYQSRWRSVLGPYLGSRAVAPREDNIRRHANALIDEFIERGSCDFVDEYAAHLPGRVFFSTFLQVPLDDLAYIQQATDDAVRLPRAENESEDDYIKRRADGWNRVGEYLTEYMHMREKEPPRGDFVDAIMQGVETDDGAPAPDPSLHPQALEELFRYYASILALGRTAMEDTEIAGEPVKKGELVMLAYSVGCRDPRVFENPDKIDIDRTIKSNLAFGWGPHRCPGNHIARMQARITLEELLRRMPDIELADGAAPAISHSTVTRNWDTLQLRYSPDRRENVPIDDKHGSGP